MSENAQLALIDVLVVDSKFDSPAKIDHVDFGWNQDKHKSESITIHFCI